METKQVEPTFIIMFCCDYCHVFQSLFLFFKVETVQVVSTLTIHKFTYSELFNATTNHQNSELKIINLENF